MKILKPASLLHIFNHWTFNNPFIGNLHYTSNSRCQLVLCLLYIDHIGPSWTIIPSWQSHHHSFRYFITQPLFDYHFKKLIVKFSIRRQSLINSSASSKLVFFPSPTYLKSVTRITHSILQIFFIFCVYFSEVNFYYAATFILPFLKRGNDFRKLSPCFNYTWGFFQTGF